MSENRKYTPGPWCANLPYDDPRHPFVGVGCDTICRVETERGWETAVANTLLIAAAPEMRELLEEIREAFAKECCISCSKCHELQDRIDKVLWKSDYDRVKNPKLSKSIWHPAEEIPKLTGDWTRVAVLRGNGKGMETIVFTRYVGDIGWFRKVQENDIRKWAYMRELEAL